MTGLPATPPGRAAGWLLGVTTSAKPVSVEELEERCSPEFSAAIPPDNLKDFLERVAAALDGGTLVAVDEAGALGLDLLVEVGDAEEEAARYEVHVAVEDDDPHRITALKVTPHEVTDSVAALDELAPTAPERGRDTLAAPVAELVDQAVHDARTRLRLTGLHVTVVHPGGVHHAHAGLADVAAELPWHPGTVHRIGSVTKTMTAAAVVRLAEAGHFDLAAAAADHLTSIDVDPRVTIRHLLTHASGLTTDAAAGTPGPVNPLTVPELLADGLQCRFEPGTAREYSNVGFALLGQLVADVTGTLFADHLAGELFEPVGMRSTVVGEQAMEEPAVGEQAMEEPAVGYAVRFGRVVAEPWYAITMPAAGAAWSTPDDMARWMEALVGGAPDVIGDEVRRQMFATTGTRVGAGEQALGMVVFEPEHHRLAWHNGGWPGWSASMWVAPDEGWGVYLASNTGDRTGGGDDLDAAGFRLARQLLTAAL